MASDWIELAKEGIKLATHPRYSFSIWFTSLLLLAAPLPEFLHLDQTRSDHGHIIGITCLFFFVLWCVEIVLFLAFHASEYLKNYLEQNAKLKYLYSLNSDEATLLSHCVEQNCQTVIWRSDHNQVDSLVAKGLLERVPVDNKNRFGYSSYTIPQFVWDYIKKDYVLTKLKTMQKAV